MLNNTWLTIVGIGEDGWDGLCEQSRMSIHAADIVAGSARQLAFLPNLHSRQITWPSPMLPYIDEFLVSYRGRPVVVLASGDPMLYGVGTIFAQRMDISELRIIPHVSAFTLACARLQWSSAHVPLVSVVNRPIESVLRELRHKQNIIVFSENAQTPKIIADLLMLYGFGSSQITVFERLGGSHERRVDGIARSWTAVAGDNLNLLAIACVADRDSCAISVMPGLPESAYDTDGQITKREVRAATLARLGPLPGELLWDVGSGSGSVAVEWMRTDTSCRSIAFERDPFRAERIIRNARALGVPTLSVVTGSAPESFAGIEKPSAIFLGGGVAAPEMINACLENLETGGRFVANAVTLQAEAILLERHASLGGELIRFSISRAEPIGGFLAWCPQMPITQWFFKKS